MHTRLIATSLLATSSLLLVACSQPASSTSSRGGMLHTDATSTRVSKPAPGADLFDATNPDTRLYASHLATLSNYFFEGRAPGVRGNELAQDYIQFYFERAGLQPAFGDSASNASFRQPFTVSGDVKVTAQEASWKSDTATSTLTPDDDFSVLGVTGNKTVSGPLVFVGYSIPDGPDGYSSYTPHDDLAGKIAVLFRFEPMTAEGKSRWQDVSGWTHNAALLPKIRAAEERGAAGVILISPPGADDPRAGKLQTTSETRFGRPISIPAIMLSDDAASKLLAAADTDHRSIQQLRALADADGPHAPIDLPNATITINAGIETLQIPTANVAGVIRGKGSLADQYVVIGAHYDHLGYGHFGSRGGPEADGHIHPGADDNASGTAGILFLADRLSNHYAKLPTDANARSIMLIGFSAEESGLNGSRKFVETPPIATSQIYAMINMDMIGRLRDKLEVGGVGTAADLEAILQPHVTRAGITVQTSKSGQGPSDHASFYSADIPVLFFFTGLHEQYHMPTDTFDTINYTGGARIANLVGDVALTLASRAEALPFTSTGTRQMGSLRGSRVRLGIAPGAYGDDKTGVLVGEVYPETSAAKAGIQKGDRIIRWAGEELVDVQDMTNRLSNHKPGDIVDMVVVRDGKEIPVRVTMLARQSRNQ